MPYKDIVEQKANQKRYRERHRNEIRERNRRWRRANLEKSRASSLRTERKLRQEALELLGGATCVRCGFNDWRALQVDHIYGGGARVRGNRTPVRARWIREHLHEARQQLQVLCANCNFIKRHENYEFRPPRKW